jgi:hypothetical protein
MAAAGFKGLGWFLCGVVVAPACYMVTSAGAAERARLQTLEAKIVAARKDIRGLETEYNTRANMAQLDQWNGEALQLAAPLPQQFASETQLANLDSLGVDEIETASLVVPAGAPRALPQPAVEARTETASAHAVPVPTPALEKRPAPAVVRTAADDSARVRGTAVALLDDKLMRDLRQRANVEKLALR